MRWIGQIVVGAAALLPGLAWAADGACEYRHPGHPSWNFFTDCSYETEIADGVTTTVVAVSNGSRFTTVEAEGADGSLRVTVNDLAASRIEETEGSRCYRTEAEAELICIHPVGTPAPAAPVAPAALPSGALDTGFGGGQSGYCLLSQGAAGAETLTDYGACVKRENCLESSEGGTTCLTEFDWASGRTTEMARADGWQTLDGGNVTPGAAGCVVDETAGVQFCYSRGKMTAAEHPVLATVPE